MGHLRTEALAESDLRWYLAGSRRERYVLGMWVGAPFLGFLFSLYSCPDARNSVFTFEILLTGQGHLEEDSLCVALFFPDVPL